MTQSQPAKSERGAPPIPVGERIVSHPFDHYGVVGPNSHRTICEVILDEPMKHTHRVWSAWNEIQREGEYHVEEAQRRVQWTERDVESAAESAAWANQKLKEARSEATAARKALKDTEARYA